jgi:hypothetical protein
MLNTCLLALVIALLLGLLGRVARLIVEARRRDERQETLAGQRYEDLRRYAFRLENDITRRNNDEEEMTEHSTKGQRDGGNHRGP